MATITWEELVQKGGGNIHYLWTVAGYPWVVTDHPDVATLLDAGDTAGKDARKKIFGSTLLNSPEILTDGDMEADDTSAWGSQRATLTKRTDNPKRGDRYLRSTAEVGTSGSHNARQGAFGTAATYRVQGWVRSDGTQTPLIYGSSTKWTGTTSKEWQRIDVEFADGSANVYVYLMFITAGAADGTEYCDWDDISVKKVTTYLAENTAKFPIFTLLQNFGKQSWRLDETKGSISGGDFTVEISDEDLPILWSTTANIGNTDSLGLPGVQSMAQPRADSAVGWGTLRNPCTQHSTSIVVNEQDGGTLETGIPNGGDPDTEYRLLWVGQECVAASFIMPNSPEELTDGDMEAVGTAAWTEDRATLSKGTTNPKEGTQYLRVTATVQVGLKSHNARQNALEVGKTYRVRGWTRSDGSQTPIVYCAGNQWLGSTSTSWQEIDVEITAGEQSIYFIFFTTDAAGTEYCDWDGITVKEVTTSNDITLSARGVARSRDADHWTRFFENVTSPLVIDTPPSIIDKPCTLWAIGLTDDGGSILTQPVAIREGVVGTNVVTNNGMTSISCLSVLNRLDNDFQLPKYDGKLARYVLYRGNVGVDDATTSYGVYRRFEMPHLVIKEFSPGVPGPSNAGTNKYIWLCARNSSVEADSPEDLLQLLAEELGRCEATDADANQSQLSGDSTVGYTQLAYHYEIRDGKLAQMDTDGSWSVTLSLITGPLAWCFNLGTIAGANQTLPNGWGNSDMAGLIGHKRPWFMFPTPLSMELNTGVGISTKDPWMVCLSGVYTESKQYFRTNTYLEPHDNWVADYYYSFQWSESVKNDLAIGQITPATYDFNVPEEAGGSTSYLYLRGEDAATQFIAGDEIVTGTPTDDFEPGRPNYASFTISTIAADDGYTKIAPTSEVISRISGMRTPFIMGRPMFSMRALDLASQDGNTDDPDENYDMWAIGHRTSASATTLGQLFKGVLNDPGNGLDIPSILQLTHVVGFTTEYDSVSMIDWDDLDEKCKHAQQQLGLGDYKFLLKGTVNLYDMFRTELVLHGLSPTYEWNSENDQFQIGFRYLAPLNETEAAFGGRAIDNNNLIAGHTTATKHNDEWIANTAMFKANHDNGRFYRTYNLTYDSGFAMNRNARRTISLSSIISHIGVEKNEAEKFFSSLLYHFATPDPVLRADLGFNAFLDIALGREVAVTDETARKPFNHFRGLTDQPALVTTLSFGPMGKPGQSVSYRVSDITTTGWAPACYVQGGNSTKGGSSRITCQSDLHEFSNLSDRVDCMWFGCYSWNSSTNTYTLKDCGCGEYKILAFERYTKSITVLEFNVYSISSDGEIVIEDQDGTTNYDLWSEAANYVLVFADWDDVEDCQKKFVYHADENNSLGSGNDRGFRWG